MLAETVVAVGLAGVAQRGVDGGDDLQSVAPRVVAAEQIAIQALDNKRLRGAEYLRLGAAEAVNALLGVADQKHAGRRARATVAAEPA